MPIPKLDRQYALGAFKATGSNDPDVLYARKEALLADTKRMSLLGIVPVVIGSILTLTIIGAIAGIPMLIFGLWARGRIKSNERIAEASYREYMDVIAGGAGAAAIAGGAQ